MGIYEMDVTRCAGVVVGVDERRAPEALKQALQRCYVSRPALPAR